MISTYEVYRLRIFDLEGQQQHDRLQRVRAAIDVVPEEEVVDVRDVPLGGWAAELREQAHEVPKLAVQVAEYLDGRPEAQHGRLVLEARLRQVAQVLNGGHVHEEVALHGRGPVAGMQQRGDHVLVDAPGLPGAMVQRHILFTRREQGGLVVRVRGVVAHSAALILELVQRQLADHVVHCRRAGRAGLERAQRPRVHDHYSIVQTHIRRGRGRHP
mmetsp:Transcript_25633/g.42855  ORF Transcript_25633/g.42855 Transcript_25633/m.42855 type:complete len:215 (+) Transcript_25633:1200-1844(+)